MANPLTAIIPTPGVATPGPHMINLNSGWSIQDSIETYNIANWSKGYFSINSEGNVVVQPEKNPQRSIDLKKLVDQLALCGIQLPVLIRFTDILQHRLAEMHDAFQTAIQENSYQGKHICVYPIKVNQQRHVVEEILPSDHSTGGGSKREASPNCWWSWR